MFAGLGLAFAFALAGPACAQDTATSAKEQERALIQVLRSDAPPGEKAIACKKLAIYGTGEAVPALAPLLFDERFASWARIALEAIPGPAPDKALRQAAGDLRGRPVVGGIDSSISGDLPGNNSELQARLLVGVINSIGVRRDKEAVNLLAHKLNDSDAAVAAAAAVSLGKIGDPQAAAALRRALAKAPATLRPAIAEGCVRCADNLLAEARRADAIKLYDAVRQAALPRQKILEGIRGSILARGSAGIPLLMEALRSNDRQYFNLGLRVARELPGRDATEAVAREFRQAAADRRPLLLLALGDRADATARAVVMRAAGNSEKPVRCAAIEILDRSGDASALGVLLNDATNEDPEISQPSLAALARLPGGNVDSELVARLPDSSGRMREALITVAARRGVERALPLIVRSVGDPNAETRAAAIQALTLLGGKNEVAELTRALEKSRIPDERAHIEKVLVALSGRVGPTCVPPLLALN